jgi:hypothetical protein
MSSSFLDRLAELDVAPPPPEFDRQLHERVNRSLLNQHLCDMALGAFPLVIAEFAKAVAAALVFTSLGRYPQTKQAGESAPRRPAGPEENPKSM